MNATAPLSVFSSRRLHGPFPSFWYRLRRNVPLARPMAAAPLLRSIQVKGRVGQGVALVRASLSCVSRLVLSALCEGMSPSNALHSDASAARCRGLDSGGSSAQRWRSLAHFVRSAPVIAGVRTEEGCSPIPPYGRGSANAVSSLGSRVSAIASIQENDRARTQARVRVLRHRPSARIQQRIHLHLRVHVLRFVRRLEAWLQMPQLRW